MQKCQQLIMKTIEGCFKNHIEDLRQERRQKRSDEQSNEVALCEEQEDEPKRNHTNKSKTIIVVRGRPAREGAAEEAAAIAGTGTRTDARAQKF